MDTIFAAQKARLADLFKAKKPNKNEKELFGIKPSGDSLEKNKLLKYYTKVLLLFNTYTFIELRI